jgi:uroporphyrinogen decarboxylase
MIASKMNRRDFVKASALGMATLAAGCQMTSSTKQFNKRDAVLSLLNEDKKQDYIPAGFFIHFGDKYKWGDAAIDRHLEYFRAIDMDFIKIQNEKELPKMPGIKKPADWKNIPLYKKDFFDDQLYIVKGLIDRAKKEAPVIVTLYSPFMCAGQVTSDEIRTEHLKEDPESVKKGMEIITESVLTFAKECISLGADGFLACTQGGEGYRFEDQSIFERYIKPFDMILMEEINASCNCNILHICDHHGEYDDLTPFVDYPTQAVNCCLNVKGKRRTPSYMYELFNKPFMGGIEKRGIISSGTQEQIQQAVSEVIDEASEKFLLGSSCTLPANIDWKKVRTAVNVAHGYSRIKKISSTL